MSYIDPLNLPGPYPPEVLDRVLGVSAPPIDNTVEQMPGRSFLENFSGLEGQNFGRPSNFLEGLISGTTQGLGRQGTRAAAQRAQFEAQALERQKERNKANLDASAKLRDARSKGLAARNQRTEEQGRKDAEFARDNPVVDDALLAAYPALAEGLAPMKGRPISQAVLQRMQLEAPEKKKAADRQATADDLRQKAADRANNLAQAQTLNQIADDYQKDPDIATYRGAAQNFETMKAGSAQNNGVGDLAMLISYVRATEPGLLSVVRQEELSNVTSAIPALERAKAIPANWLKGDRLTEGARRFILKAGKDIADSRKGAFEVADRQYGSRAAAFGADPGLFRRTYSTELPPDPAAGPQPTGERRTYAASGERVR